MAEAMYKKPFRPKDEAMLEQVAEMRPGNIWRQPLVNAAKRAGATVFIDGQKRLHITFGEHALHPSRLDLGMCEEGETPFRRQLQALARDLLAHARRFTL